VPSPVSSATEPVVLVFDIDSVALSECFKGVERVSNADSGTPTVVDQIRIRTVVGEAMDVLKIEESYAKQSIQRLEAFIFLSLPQLRLPIFDSLPGGFYPVSTGLFWRLSVRSAI
jgi:hypothetical protein